MSGLLGQGFGRPRLVGPRDFEVNILARQILLRGGLRGGGVLDILARARQRFVVLALGLAGERAAVRALRRGLFDLGAGQRPAARNAGKTEAKGLLVVVHR